MLAVCAQPRAWEYFRPRRPRPPRNPWLWVLLAVLAVELSMLPLRRPRVAEAPADVDGAVLITNDHEWGNKPVRRIIPPAPPEGSGWERPPCREKWMHTIQGACWAKVEGATPPCSAGLYEHRGGCFSPIVKGQRPPSSIGR